MGGSTLQSLRENMGREIGISDWVVISQDMIDRFADLTDDHLYIHTDPIAAASGPFGCTVAHGFLILSMIARLLRDVDFRIGEAELTLNYGFDKVRMVSPVKAGGRIRGRVTLKDIKEREPGQWLTTLAVVIEADGQVKPVVVADWLGLQVAARQGDA